MEKQEVVHAVTAALEARLSNDVSRTLDAFSDSASLRLVGSEQASEIAQVAVTQEELSASLTALIGTWQWISYRILSLIVDGDRAAIRYLLNARHMPTNELVEIETMDEMLVGADGKIMELIEFLDTAKTEKMAAKAR